MNLRLLSVLLFVAVAARGAYADDIGVSRVELREVADDRTVMLVRVPAAAARYFRPPRLHGGSEFAADGLVPAPGGGTALRFKLERGLRDSDVIRLPWGRQGVLVWARFADGTEARRLFMRRGVAIDVAIDALRPPLSSPWVRMRQALLDGVPHFVGSFLHIAFVIAVAFTGSVRRALAWSAAFLVGQLIGWGAVAALGTGLPPPSGELAIGLATAFLGAAALSPRGESVGPAIVFLAGTAHAAGLPGAGLTRFGAIVGHDAVLLLGVGLVTLLWRAAPRVRRARGWAAALLGSGSLGLVLLWVFESPHAVQFDAQLVRPGPEAVEPLPGGPLDDGFGAAPPTSPPPAPPVPDLPLQAFLVIEPFEVRLEVLARARDLPGIGARPEIPVGDQRAVKERLARFLRADEIVQIDGRDVRVADQRIDFVTAGPRGIVPRSTAVPERTADARLGMVLVFRTASIAQEVTLEWRAFDPVADEVPISVTDPEQRRRSRLTPARPTLRWKNDLTLDPLPRIDSVRFQRDRFALPVVALPLFVVAIVFAIRSIRTRGRASALARLALILALLVAPVAEWHLPRAVVGTSTPGQPQAERIVQALLSNVYRAFAFRDEEAAYDRLSASVTGEQLAKIYLEQRRALRMEELGGARASLESVDVTSIQRIEPVPGGFEAECVWTVAGSVSHFGHRHYRQNRYLARIAVRVNGDAWKIVGIEVLDERRVL